jgi:hypothetical protein
MYQLGSLAFSLSDRLPVLILIGMALALAYFYLSFGGQTIGFQRAHRGIRPGRKNQTSILSFVSRDLEEKARDEEEFRVVNGMSTRRHSQRTMLIAGGVALLTFVFSSSIVVTVFAGVYAYAWYHGRASARVRKAREKSLRDELLPFAHYISRALERNGNMYEALGDLVRSDPATPLKAAIRRALASTRTLEAGLRAEEAYAGQKAVREFFEILSEGASANAKVATTRAALERYYELNLRVRTVYQKALQATSQARSTRIFMTGLIPFFYLISLVRTGPDLMFHSLGGNIITFCAFAAISIAFLLSNRSINGVLKGF